MGFEVEASSSGCRARTGVLATRHGKVETPLFMPVATAGAVKTVAAWELAELGAGALIANSFLLSLRPGAEAIASLGGLHKFTSWDGIFFTDSGGFQMIRKGYLLKASDERCELRSPYDGKAYSLTPERSVEIQRLIGSDVAMVLDDCPPAGAAEADVRASLARTTAWARRALAAHPRDGQLQFAIVQGGVFDGLRRASAEALAALDFDGYGIGGLAIGETKDEMFRALDVSVACLPPAKPRYFMGVGEPTDILNSIERGVDVFDSVYPTRNARHETILTRDGKYNISQSRFAGDESPLEEGCSCPICGRHTRSYVHHLFKVKEMLAMRLASLHNIHFTLELVRAARIAIREERFAEFKADAAARLAGGARRPGAAPPR